MLQVTIWNEANTAQVASGQVTGNLQNGSVKVQINTGLNAVVVGRTYVMHIEERQIGMDCVTLNGNQATFQP